MLQHQSALRFYPYISSRLYFSSEKLLWRQLNMKNDCRSNIYNKYDIKISLLGIYFMNPKIWSSKYNLNMTLIADF